jgi:hypothetical protein
MGFKVRNYDLDSITYFDMEKRKFRQYHPDFIIEDFIITEVKHVDGFIFEKKKKEIAAKSKAAENFCIKSDRYMFLFATNHMFDKKFVDMGKKIHKKRK